MYYARPYRLGREQLGFNVLHPRIVRFSRPLLLCFETDVEAWQETLITRLNTICLYFPSG